MSNEDFYDEEIAPVLLELADKCKARGMSFAAAVEYAPGDTGETIALVDPGIKMLLAAWGIQCHGNVDSLMIQVQRHAKQHGHSSMILNLLKVPLQPTPNTSDCSLGMPIGTEAGCCIYPSCGCPRKTPSAT